MSDIINPIRKILRHTLFYQAEVQSIDLHARRVTVTHGPLAHHQEFAFDHLVLALGSETNFFNLPGVAERAATMKSGADALLLRNRVIALLENASLEERDSVRHSQLTFVVAGGGFSGVETVGALNDFVRTAVKSYPKLDPSWIRVHLIHPGKIILPELGERLGLYAEKKLRQRGVDVRTGTRVRGYSSNEVELDNRETIKAATLVWTAGVTPASVLRDLPCKKEQGRLVVDLNLEVPEFPGVWAVGDCAWILNPKTGEPHPPTAQHAVREGTQLGKNIAAAICGGPKKPFIFSTLGQLATIGRRAGVANILGMQFSGFIAWVLWRTVYLLKLPRLEKKVRVALGWTLNLFFPPDIVQYITVRDVESLHARLTSFREEASQAKSQKTMPAEPFRNQAPSVESTAR
jgi:NADH dehydrogenase